MGSLSTVFSAEVMAILWCTEFLLTKYISSDSRAALPAKPTAESSLVWECMQVLEKLSKFNKVTLMWTPGHQEIPGNEEADRLTKEGAVEVPPNQSAAVSFSVGKNLLLLLTKYHSGDQVKKTEMGRTCGTYGGEERCI
jgi:hypothetical protein